MSANIEKTETAVRREYDPICWCGPTTTIGASLFGSVLLFIGGVLLLDNLDLVPAQLVDSLWPIVIIVIGLAYLGWAYYAQKR